MRSLLDVNVLIALLDADHSLHAPAIQWFGDHAGAGWATCPSTQNGCVRIMSHPGYPNVRPVTAIVERLAEAAGSPLHEFWADDVSLLDAAMFVPARIHGPRQLTDVYLLAMAVQHNGRLATFDVNVNVSAVRGAGPEHLLVI